MSSKDASTENTAPAATAAMGAGDVPAGALLEAVEFARFEKMRKLEAASALGSARLKPAAVAEPESCKDSRGMVGGFRGYLSGGDRAFLDRVLRKGNIPLLAPYVVRTAPLLPPRWLRAAGMWIVSPAQRPQMKVA